jgi:glycosyltransferase involved in cell wall biosynthesis
MTGSSGMRVALIAQPWDRFGADGRAESSIALILRNLGHRLAREGSVLVLAGSRTGQPVEDVDAEGVRYHRCQVTAKPIFQLLDRITSFWDLDPPLFTRSLYFRGYARQVAAAVRDFDADIVHLSSLWQFAPIIKAIHPRAKIVLQMQAETLSLVRPDLRERALACVDLVLGCSDFIAGRIREALNGAGPRCGTLYNGVDPTLFAPRPDGTPRNQRRLLFVGRLSPEKGIHVLLRAFTELRRRHHHLQLDLVGAPGLLPYAFHLGLTRDPTELELKKFYGNGPLDKFMRQVVRKDTSYLMDLRRALPPEVQEAVHFHGPLAQACLGSRYAGATVFVFPSVWNEPFGMPVAEAMAASMPVVATLSGGIPEIVENGVTGKLVARGDPEALAEALDEVLADPARCEAMGAAGRHRILRDLTWDTIGGRLIKYYREVLA